MGFSLDRVSVFEGSFNPRAMMQVLDTPLDKGGAAVEGTIYQVIAVPAEKKVWLKVLGRQDWTEVALDPFFRGK